jgi:hypothetical protein
MCKYDLCFHRKFDLPELESRPWRKASKVAGSGAAQRPSRRVFGAMQATPVSR